MTAVADGVPLRLLYIDDDYGFARLVSRALGRKGFETVHASGGDEGLARLDEGGFDVIALDHFMPGRSGESTLAAIRERPGAPPVVYVTGSDEGRVAVAALKAGAADYVLKDAGESFFDLLAETLRQAHEAARIRQEKRAAQAEVAAQRDRAEMLLKEVNHRVANSLALVSSLAHMQASALPDGPGRDAMRDFQRRVTAIAQVHRRLYTSDDVTIVSLDSYLSGLVEELSAAMEEGGAHPRLRLEAEPVNVPTDKAIALGVVVSELVTNAVKYAYAGREPGEIRIRLVRDADGVALLVEDDGIGLGDGPPRGTGLGSRVLEAMARGLKSTLSYAPSPGGTRARLHFQP